MSTNPDNGSAANCINAGTEILKKSIVSAFFCCIKSSLFVSSLVVDISSALLFDANSLNDAAAPPLGIVRGAMI